MLHDSFDETELPWFSYKQIGTSCMGTDFYNTSSYHFLTSKCERLFLGKNYNNSAVQQNSEPGN